MGEDLSWDAACATVTAPGTPFELVDDSRCGRRFAGGPRTLREVFAMARPMGTDVAAGDQTFLVYENERWSFAEVMANVDALAHALVHHYDIGRGDRVAIGMRNFPEWIVSMAAITSVGAISVSLNSLWTEDELAFALDDCAAALLIADPERIGRCERSCRAIGARMLVVRPGGPLAPDVEPWSDVVKIGMPMPDIEVDPDDDATILYTSGTTGRPKGAVSSNAAVVSALMSFGGRAAADALMAAAERPADAPPPDPPPPTVFILIVPLFHVTGCVAVMLGCFVSKARLVIMHRWDVERALELIERERVTHFVGVPTQSWDLVNAPRFADFDTSTLRNVGGGGAPAPPALVEKVAANITMGGPIIGYGMTETNAFGPGNSGPAYLSHPRSTGRLFPSMRIEIRDPAGREVPTGELGEIWFNGPMLIRGYWNRVEATAETIVDGWLRSGDVGRVDDDGFLYIEDRLKDMILRGGENVYCAEVEAALYEHPSIHEAAVFGVPDERLGEQVAVAIHAVPSASPSVDDLRSFLADRIAAFKIPTRFLFLPDPLPRNPAGKFLKRQLRDLIDAPTGDTNG